MENLKKELKENLEKWLKKSRVSFLSSIINFQKVDEEIEMFCLKKLLVLPPKKLKTLLEEVSSEIEGIQRPVFFKVVRKVLELNPQLYPLDLPWSETKSMLTLGVEKSLSDALKGNEILEILPPFVLAISGYSEKLTTATSLSKSLLYPLLKNSFVVEVIFDYLSYVQPEPFVEWIFTGDEKGEYELDLNGIAKISKLILDLWFRDRGKKKFFIFGRKSGKIVPVVLKFIRSHKREIEDIAERETFYYLTERILENPEAKEKLINMYLSDLEEETRDILPEDRKLLAEMMVSGTSLVDPEELILSYDSDSIYRLLSEILTEAMDDKDDETIIEIVILLQKLFDLPYISRNYDYTYIMIAVLLISFLFSDVDFFADEVGKEEFLRRAFPSLKGKESILKALYVSENYSLIVELVSLLSEEEREELLEGSLKLKLLFLLSKYFTGTVDAEAVTSFLKENERSFDILWGENQTDVLSRLITGGKVTEEEIHDPLGLLFFYPYEKLLYEKLNPGFEYRIKKPPDLHPSSLS